MKEYFYDSKMWCESKYPHMQKACKLLASEEMKHLAYITVIVILIRAVINLVRPPIKKAFKYIKKMVLNIFKKKRPMPKVPQPCVLKVNTKVDIEKWILQARLYIEPLEEHRRKDMLMMLVDEPQRERLESHSLFVRAIDTDEHIEHLFNVIKTMYKKKEGSPTENKKKFLKKNSKMRLTHSRLRSGNERLVVSLMARITKKPTRRLTN